MATWDGGSKSNTFQLVLVTDGRRSFALSNYNKITWNCDISGMTSNCCEDDKFVTCSSNHC